jgi:hypothetical protein
MLALAAPPLVVVPPPLVLVAPAAAVVDPPPLAAAVVDPPPPPPVLLLELLLPHPARAISATTSIGASLHWRRGSRSPRLILLLLHFDLLFDEQVGNRNCC